MDESSISVNDVIQMLQSDYNSKNIEVTIPSSNVECVFKPINASHYRELSKIAIIDNQNLNIAIDNLLMQLCVSNNLNTKNITEYDKTYIFIKIKAESTDDVECSGVCNKQTCNNEVKSKFDVARLDEDRKFGEDTIQINNIKIKLLEPTVFQIREYERHCDSEENILEGNKIKSLYKVYSKLNERPILFVNKIYVDGQEVEEFNLLPFKEKLNIINMLEVDIVDLDKINNYIAPSFSNFTKEFECDVCNHKFNGVINYNDILL